MQVVKKTALTALCFCVVSAAGFGVLKNLPDREKPAAESDPEQIITVDPSTAVDEKTGTDVALSEEDKVTATQKRKTTIQTSTTTSATARNTSVSDTTVTQSRAVTSRITEATARTEMSVSKLWEWNSTPPLTR